MCVSMTIWLHTQVSLNYLVSTRLHLSLSPPPAPMSSFYYPSHFSCHIKGFTVGGITHPSPPLLRPLRWRICWIALLLIAGGSRQQGAQIIPTERLKGDNYFMCCWGMCSLSSPSPHTTLSLSPYSLLPYYALHFLVFLCCSLDPLWLEKRIRLVGYLIGYRIRSPTLG